MKTIIQDTSEFVEYKFSHNTIEKTIKYFKKDYANEISEIADKSDQEYQRWIHWIEN